MSNRTLVGLGDKVIDSVSGFEGIAVSQHDYLNGCTRITVQPPIGKDGKLPAPETFDEPQLLIKKLEAVKRGPTNVGGPEKYSPSERLLGDR